jgi:hypothetical protein
MAGDKYLTKKNLEKYHVVHTCSKRKKDTHKMVLEILEIEESPQAMDVDEIIKEPNWSEQRLLETQEITKALVTQEPKIFEEEFVTLIHVTYNRNSKIILMDKVNMKNKKVSEKWKLEIDFHGVAPSKSVQFHEATREALKEFVYDIEKEKLIL